MIPPTTNELKQHTNDIANFGKNLRKMNGSGKALINVAVVTVALVSAITFLLPMASNFA